MVPQADRIEGVWAIGHAHFAALTFTAARARARNSCMSFSTPILFAAAAAPPQLTADEVLAPHIYVFYAAFIIAFVFTPVMRVVATYYQIVDRPDQSRKVHSVAVAYLGGVAMFLGWIAGLALSQ